MMAHLRPIPKHTCQCCWKAATVELYNTRNAPYGYFCRACGKRKMAELAKEETVTNKVT